MEYENIKESELYIILLFMNILHIHIMLSHKNFKAFVL